MANNPKPDPSQITKRISAQDLRAAIYESLTAEDYADLRSGLLGDVKDRMVQALGNKYGDSIGPKALIVVQELLQSTDIKQHTQYLRCQVCTQAAELVMMKTVKIDKDSYKLCQNCYSKAEAKVLANRFSSVPVTSISRFAELVNRIELGGSTGEIFCFKCDKYSPIVHDHLHEQVNARS